MNTVQKATLVKVMPTKVWAEKGFNGVVYIKTQHEGEKESFDFVQINYDYRYTSNSHQQQLAFAILKIFGVEDADCKIMQATTNLTEAERECIAVLQNALTKCAAKFSDYERHHLGNCHYEKATANKAMADMCRDAVNKSNILQMMS